MTAAQRKNIGRGVRYAAMRKRQSEAMKASWARRRASNGVNPIAAIYDSVHASREATVATKRDNLHKVAQLLGIDTDEVIRDEIRKALGV